jgi:acyl-CoA thioesterase FadM
MDFMRPIQPDSELVLNVWPVRVEGRKISMEGSIKIAEQCSGQMILAARATALFILPRPNNVENNEAEEVDLRPAA